MATLTAMCWNIENLGPSKFNPISTGTTTSTSTSKANKSASDALIKLIAAVIIQNNVSLCGLLEIRSDYGKDIAHCTGQKIKIADIVDKYDALAPLTHSRAASGSRAAPLACLVDLRGCFESDQIHSEKHSWLGVYVFLYESVSNH